MVIDLHIHSKNSDGVFTVEEIFTEAKLRNITFMSITDHDTIESQELAIEIARKTGIRYVSGVELNVSFFSRLFQDSKSISLDFLGYNFDIENSVFSKKLQQIANYREQRAARILESLNSEFKKEGIRKLTKKDFEEIAASVDGTLGRPHIADYLVRMGIVMNRQEAFDKYLVRCNVPKYPLYLKEASKLVRDAGGKLVLAHPNDPHGTSLFTVTRSLSEQTRIIEASILDYIDGVECWHSRNDDETTSHYLQFARRHDLIVTGGSDCHQKPVLMGTTPVPDFVAINLKNVFWL